MIAVDTNVLARYLTNDEPAQAARALELMTREQVFLFADALHVASSGSAERFMTFDNKLAKRALTPVTVLSI